MNFHPVGFRNGKKLRRFISLEGKKLEIVIRNWDDFNAIDKDGNVVLDFVDEKGNDVSTDEDRMFVDLNGYSYKDRTGRKILIQRCWYEDEHGNEVEPDTITGEFSDMPHVLSFLGRPYDQVFNILMQDDRIASLMAPFKSAYENKANDQLEGMVGTLRVNAARLVSPEAYWVFTGDDFDLKISDRANPSYLVIANDPEKEQVIGSLNALVLNRLITRVNSKGNIPVSIIVDELPTLYFHKIDRLIGTARSNKVAVTLGFQELPQLEADYGKVGMQKIITTCGNIFMGAARNKETLEWHRMMCSERQSRPLVPFPSMTIRYQPQSLRRWTFWFLQPRLRIWQQAWIDANTEMYICDTAHDCDGKWCEECEENVDFCSLEEFKQIMQSWWTGNDIRTLEGITGLKETDYLSNNSSQTFAGATDKWWYNLDYDGKRNVYNKHTSNNE